MSRRKLLFKRAIAQRVAKGRSEEEAKAEVLKTYHQKVNTDRGGRMRRNNSNHQTNVD